MTVIAKFKTMMRGASWTALVWAGAATAQNTSAPPIIITPPSQTFSLPPSTSTPAPTPTPTPSPAPTPSPTPAATPTAAPPPLVRTVPTAPAPTPVVTPVAPAPRAHPRTVTPVPATTSASPQPTPSAPVREVEVAPPVATGAVPTPAEAPPAEAGPAQPEPALPPWVLPLGAVIVIGAGAGLWLRRRRVAADGPFADEPAIAAVPIPAEQPSPPARPLAAAAPAPIVEAVPGLAIAFRPVSLFADTAQVVLEFELTIVNGSGTSIDAIRPTVAITTAHPAIEKQIATFGDTIPMSGSGDSFDLAAGGERRIVGELILPREAMHVSQVGRRPMAVPIVLAHVRWRAGLSVKSHVEAHVVGTGDATQKLGPLWLDRPRTQTRQLGARRI